MSQLLQRVNGRFLRFGVVGCIGTGLNVLILRILYGELHLLLPLASAIAVEMTIITNFLLNNRWTFGERSISPTRLARYNLAALGGLIITTTILTFLTTSVGVPYIAADLVGIAAATAWNFATSILWTWAR
ncbi:MAG TPA: GtrA family protein [Chloroflexota bacterium]|nr:GtrA family protein [Chloroflexota bacterium]